MSLSECNLVIVLVHAPASVPGLGASRPLGHDDLVHPQHGGGGVGRVLQSPLLGNHQIQNIALCTILKKGYIKSLAHVSVMKFNGMGKMIN